MGNHFNTDVLIVYTFLFAVGASIGSFLNVVIYRLPRSKSIVSPRSACPSCGTPIPLYLNIPVLSYLILRGKCKYCKARISPRYPIIELISGLLVVGYYALYGPTFHTLAATIMTLMLVPVFLIDFEHKIIPDVISIPGILIGFGLSFFTQQPTWSDSLIGIIVGGGGFLAVGLLGDFLFKKESLGGGDVKLAAMLGAFLGWQKVLFIFIASASLGLVGAIVMMIISSRAREDHQIPFGPFMATAAVIALLFGDRLISLYIDRFLSI